MKNISTNIAAFLLLASTSAWALSYDQNVNFPNPGVYYGSGNANGGWTVDTQNNIELGLRAHLRFPSANTFNSAGNGIYSFTDGIGVGGSPANRATWNYDFSINVNANTLGSANLTGYTFSLALDYNPGIGQTWSIINPLSIVDDALANSGSPAAVGPDVTVQGGASLSDYSVAQNSENPGFAFEGLPGYNKTIAGTYDIILSAYNLAGGLAAQTFVRINVNGGTTSAPLTSVPDSASTMLLLGATVSSLAFIRRKLAR